jgi:hypothetical protein
MMSVNSQELIKTLSRLSDQTLLAQTEKLAQDERDLLTTLLHHLHEIDRRQLFSALELPSLFEYAKQHLHYSEDQAYRRIDAMKLLREVPEIEEKINSGAINLTQLSSAQTFFRKEKAHSKKHFTKAEKLAVLTSLENKSTRDTDKAMLALTSNPLVHARDQSRAVGEDRIEYKFTGNNLLDEKFARLKGLLAHRFPYITMNQLLHELCDIGLKKLDPRLQTGRTRKNDKFVSSSTHVDAENKQAVEAESEVKIAKHTQYELSELSLQQ